jgi:HAD superfamily hydrolase (TIGR01459 family)
MKFVSGIKEIYQNYTHFILDVWGVVHDGRECYPGVIEAISFLKSEGKKVCFLSNAPRRAGVVASVLQNFGIGSDLYEFILSSGEASYLDLKQNQDEGFKKFGQDYFYIGPQKDIGLLGGLSYRQVSSMKDAGLILVTGFDHDDSTLGEKVPQILEAKKYDLPMICVNPDMKVVRKDGKEMICAGVLAQEYEALGGKVYYYGKPFSLVYEMTSKMFKNSSREKILAIGDGLETDIKGANSFGIDSLLVTGGILMNLLSSNLAEGEKKSRLEEACFAHKAFPQFVIPNLKL